LKLIRRAFFFAKYHNPWYSIFMPMITTRAGDFYPLHLLFKNASLLVDEKTEDLPDDQTISKCLEHLLVKDWFSEPEHAYTALLLEENAPAPAGYKFIPLRALFDEERPYSQKAARAHALLCWRSRTHFCSACGAPLQDDKFETARSCMMCSEQFFPTIAPAVIVLIEKEGSVLLARHSQKNTDVYTCLAGYVEHGESAEEAVAREVKEEVGITIQNIRYITSQSWPFPDQLMLAYKAEYKEGSFHLQADEIDEVKWFTRDNLPSIPKPGSVAHKLIMGLI